MEAVVPYIGTWIETLTISAVLIKDRVVPYIGTWIETYNVNIRYLHPVVVPYIGTWIETHLHKKSGCTILSYLI